MKQYFLIIHRPGPAWKQGEGFQNQNLLENGAYIHSLHQQGILIEGGPFLDHSGGMAIIQVDDETQQVLVTGGSGYIASDRQDPAG